MVARVLTQHNDNGRSGANLDETLLTPDNVNVNQFGKIFECPVNGQIYAQPLYVPNVRITDDHGAVHTNNVVYVATMRNILYAFDARTSGDPASFEAKASGATIANGLAWSPDNRTLYWTDTTQHVIRAWDWDAASNTLSNCRVFHQFPTKPAGWTYGMGGYGGRPDGAAVDVDGNYWVAMFEGGRVLKLSPAGELLAEFPTPALCPTMPSFGGDDLKTLYVTTASHNRSAAELADYPQSGCVFSTRVSVSGLPVNFFRA